MVIPYSLTTLPILNASSILLGAGTKGKRSSLRFSKTMLHQSSGGAVGNIQDARISMVEWEKTNKILFELLGGYCDKPSSIVMEDSAHDLWLSSDEAQGIYASSDKEYPVKEGVDESEMLRSWGSFKQDDINVQKFGSLQTQAIQMMDKAGYK